MAKPFARTELTPGICMGSFSDDRYKTNRISLHLLSPISKETVTQNALISCMLEKGCAAYPTLEAMNDRLADLYGATLSVDVARVGSLSDLILRVSFLADSYTLEGEPLLLDCAAFLMEILFDPKTVGDGFDPADLALEKDVLRELIESEINQKDHYAMNRCREIHFGGGRDAIPRYGYLELIDEITPQSLFAHYRHLLQTAKMELILVGKDDFSPLVPLFLDKLAGLDRGQSAPADEPVAKIPAKPQTITETMDINQNKLVMAFRADFQKIPRGEMAMRLMTLIYGGMATSKLFLNVRERLSLCYYCSASFDYFGDSLFVASGVDPDKTEVAQGEILHQLETMKNGQVSEEELAAAKKQIASALEAVYDRPSGVEAFAFSQRIYGFFMTREEQKELMQSITLAEIVAMAGNLTLTTTYCLAGEGRTA